MRHRIAAVRILSVLGVLFFLVASQPVRGDVGCGISVSPSSIKGGSTTTVAFTVQSYEGSDEITSVRIGTTAVDEFQIQSAQSSGWSGTVESSNTAGFSGGSLTSGGSQSFSLSLAAIDQDQSTIGWDVYVNDTILCTGSPGVAIYKSTTTDGLSISSIGVTGIQQSRASIVWTSSAAANSYAEYGTTSSYGSSASDSTSSTTHSLTITGLSSGTTYHYRVRSTDSQGNIATSGDFTFTTVSASSSTTTTTTTTEYVTATPTPTPVPDRVKPVVSITTEFKKPFLTAPKVEGTAQDNVRIDALEYSLDGGKNWIAVRSGVVLKKAKVSYSFTPTQTLDDGNYTVLVRATDDAGNIGVSKPVTMVIDRLPPSVGPMIVHAGPLLYEPTADGAYAISSGVRTSITFSAVGGPTQIVLRIGSETFQAHKYLYSGLWKTSFTLDRPGIYPIVATATDGAGNVNSRSLGTVRVLEKGSIQTSSGARAHLTVFVKQNQQNEFVQWDGQPYGISNPLSLNDDGEYSLVLPPGQYYLHASAQGYVPVNSEIFRLEHPTAITHTFQLRSRQTIWNTWRSEMSPVRVRLTKSARDNRHALVGKAFPQFRLSGQTRTFTDLDLRGRTSIVSVLSTWSPTSHNQLQYLRAFADTPNTSVTVLFPHEREATLALLAARIGGAGMAFIPDEDGLLTNQLSVTTTPVHFVLNNRAVVQKVVYGVLTSDELRSNLIH